MVEEKGKAKLELSTKGGVGIYLGLLDDNMDRVNNTTAERLKDAIKNVNNLEGDSKRIDIATLL